MILGISDELKMPVRFIGIGEKVEDLRAFDPEEFVDALFEPPEHSLQGACVMIAARDERAKSRQTFLVAWKFFSVI